MSDVLFGFVEMLPRSIPARRTIVPLLRPRPCPAVHWRELTANDVRHLVRQAAISLNDRLWKRRAARALVRPSKKQRGTQASPFPFPGRPHARKGLSGSETTILLWLGLGNLARRAEPEVLDEIVRSTRQTSKTRAAWRLPHWRRSEVRHFLHNHVHPGVFAPDAVSTLIGAFDGAWQSIIARGGQAFASAGTRGNYVQSTSLNTRHGELDECCLRDSALLHLSQSNLRYARPDRK
jgi:hypothetical protein